MGHWYPSILFMILFKFSFHEKNMYWKHLLWPGNKIDIVRMGFQTKMYYLIIVWNFAGVYNTIYKK